MDDYIVACICEGAAEQAIMDMLLENDKLIFSKEQLLDDKIIRIREAKKFEEQYLRKLFIQKIKLYRVLDSRREAFKLSMLYKDKVEVENVITAPEIEMLIIYSENKYKDFDKSKLKPSNYCKQKLKFSKVKTYAFVKKYFNDIDVLLGAIALYRKNTKLRKKEKTLFDLLRTGDRE